MAADTPTDGEKPHTNPDVLTELYHGEGLTLAQTADRLGVSTGAITYWMDKYGIERRSNADVHAQKLLWGGPGDSPGDSGTASQPEDDP